MNYFRRIYLVAIFQLLFIYCGAQTIAPDFTMTDSKGITRNLYTELNQGKTVVLDFFITNCGSCQINTASLDSIWQEYGYSGDSIWVWGIEVNDATDSLINLFQDQFNGTYPAFSTTVDSSIITDYGVTYTPQYFVICPAKIMKRVPISSIESSIMDCPETFSISDNTIFNNKWFNVENSEIIFSLSEDLFPVKVFLYTSSGQLFKTYTINFKHNSINLSHFPSGLYFINVETRNQKKHNGNFIKN